MREIVFAGIGPRDITEDPTIEKLIQAICKLTTKLNLTLHSGGAMGIDSIFEKYHLGPKRIFLPYEGFQGNASPLFTHCEKSYVVARRFHPIGNRLDGQLIKYMARNGYQILGQDLRTPVNFVITWTKDPTKGGTSQALRIAKAYKIPVFNLYFEKDILTLSSFLKSMLNAQI